MHERTAVRDEAPRDHAAVRAIHASAFGRAAEADLVDALRGRAQPCISLVAAVDDAVVGHIMFSPVTADGHPHTPLMGLAPMAVQASHRGRGIGSALVRAGLDRCRALEMHAVVVLGHPGYYPRFGFSPASRYGIRCPYEAPDEAFMLLELRPGALRGVHGAARYHPDFDAL
jgi:putative acetyltransferase